MIWDSLYSDVGRHVRCEKSGVVYAALLFTDAATGQGYLRVLNEWEAKLVSAQLTALDDGEMKAIPVHPFEIRKMKPGGE